MKTDEVEHLHHENERLERLVKLLEGADRQAEWLEWQRDQQKLDIQTLLTRIRTLEATLAEYEGDSI